MDTFNLKNFLIENKLTANSKLIKEQEYTEEEDYINPGNSPEQSTDREEYLDKFEEPKLEEESTETSADISKYLSMEGAEAIMKELEKDSSKSYMEAKMHKLKEVINTIEAKCTSLEEAEDLQGYVSASKLKEMKTTVKKLRGVQDKMVKEYEKKYAGKK
jgi:hypothetical protein